MPARLWDWWLAPKTFTVALMLFPLYAAASVVALWSASPLALLGWGAVLLGWWFEASLTVCRRCRHYGTWHCAGQGMIVSKVFSKRPAGLPLWRVVAHFAADAVAFFYPQYWLVTQLGWGYALASWLYLVFLVVAATPRKGASYAKASFEV
jgi:hypothetical protein